VLNILNRWCAVLYIDSHASSLSTLVRADASNQIHVARIKSEIEPGFHCRPYSRVSRASDEPPNKSERRHFRSVNNTRSEEMTDREVSKVAGNVADWLNLRLILDGSRFNAFIVRTNKRVNTKCLIGNIGKLDSNTLGNGACHAIREIVAPLWLLISQSNASQRHALLCLLSSLRTDYPRTILCALLRAKRTKVWNIAWTCSYILDA